MRRSYDLTRGPITAASWKNGRTIAAKIKRWIYPVYKIE